MPASRRTGGSLKTPETPRTVELKAESFAVRLGRLEELIPPELVLLGALFIAFVVVLISATLRFVNV